jgi:hypothetical protein
MSSNVTFVTPTYWKDYERFCIQRESIERCGIDIPHVAIVDHEDLAQFRKVPFQSNLTILSTRDVLTPHIEARRAVLRKRFRNPLRYLHRSLHGWYVQQLMKLATPDVVDTTGIVCLDSDILFVGRVRHEDFFTEDGRLHLYETRDDLDAEMGEWLCDSLRFLGVQLQKKPMAKYVHGMVPLHRRVVLEMQQFIQDKYAEHWSHAMTRAKVTEYQTYGAYARHPNGLAGLEAVEPRLCVYYWWPEETQKIEHDLVSRIRQSSGKAVLVNSNSGRPVTSYRQAVVNAWEALHV